MMAARGRLLLLVLVLGAIVALASFVGGSVGAIVFGHSPVGLFAVGTPHLELPAGRPFSGAPITNTMLASWLACGIVIAVFARATRHVELIPSGLQNFVELACELASGFIEEMVGKEHERRLFPVVMTVFLFVVVNAWIALFPGFDTLTYNGTPLLRSAHTDINVPLMLAVFCVAMIEYWGWSSRGLGYIGAFFDVRHIRAAVVRLRERNVKAFGSEFFYGALFLLVGVMEILQHSIRVLSFSFRLFGNMTAGVILTGVAIFLVPLVLPAVFYGLEVLFGVIQALIFAGLTAVFGSAAVVSAEH
jgi:F-type H+-transporting ATPase subunit a